MELDYEFIGILAFDSYVTDCVRFNAKKQRAIARNSHPCDGIERETGDGHTESYPCWYFVQPASLSSHLPDWCDNCKYVQPFYNTYMESVKKARVARYKLTCYCKKMLWNEGQYRGRDNGDRDDSSFE